MKRKIYVGGNQKKRIRKGVNHFVPQLSITQQNKISHISYFRCYSRHFHSIFCLLFNTVAHLYSYYLCSIVSCFSSLALFV